MGQKIYVFISWCSIVWNFHSSSNLGPCGFRYELVTYIFLIMKDFSLPPQHQLILFHLWNSLRTYRLTDRPTNIATYILNYVSLLRCDLRKVSWLLVFRAFLNIKGSTTYKGVTRLPSIICNLLNISKHFYTFIYMLVS